MLNYSKLTENLPTRHFLVPLEEDEEIEVQISKGNVIKIKYKAVSESQTNGTRYVQPVVLHLVLQRWWECVCVFACARMCLCVGVLLCVRVPAFVMISSPLQWECACMCTCVCPRGCVRMHVRTFLHVHASAISAPVWRGGGVRECTCVHSCVRACLHQRV